MRVGACLTRLLSALPILLLLAVQSPAQDLAPEDPVAQILVVDRARMFAESAFGKASLERERIAATALEDENAGIQAELVAEEQDLTLLRQTLSAAEFSARATAFDAKVEQIRAEQDAKARDLTRIREEDGMAFQRAALPILGELMTAMGAQVLLDRSAVILSLSSVDVTDEAIARVDAALGAGATPPVAP
jgi:Skp family chaperone for outer membrane proteins